MNFLTKTITRATPPSNHIFPTLSFFKNKIIEHLVCRFDCDSSIFNEFLCRAKKND